MFRNEEQKNKALKVMLGPAYNHHWTLNGPVDAARAHAYQATGIEAVMLRAALGLYDRSADALLTEIATLPERDRQRIAGFMAAQFGPPEAADRWINRETLSPISGDRLIALRNYDKPHWRTVVCEAIAAAESTMDLVGILGVGQRTFSRWLAADGYVQRAFEERNWKGRDADENSTAER